MRYVKKPIPVHAVCWSGKNLSEIQELCPNVRVEGDDLIIPTLEGDMRAGLFDFVIQGIKGECYPCKNEIFVETYRPM